MKKPGFQQSMTQACSFSQQICFLIFFLIQVHEHKHEKNVVCTLPLVLVKMKYIPSPATQSPTALQEACSPYESCASILDAKLCVCLNGVRLPMHSAANLCCPPVQVLKPINTHILRQTNAHPQTYPGALFNGLKHWGWHSKTLHEHPSTSPIGQHPKTVKQRKKR